mgnify:CR=1 FL=1|tara:strand:- start:292 stop:771 length:480 start_codon:yes stop_codon:yes gene_type:complete
MKKQKLYDLPRKRWVLVIDDETRVPPGAKEISKDDLIYFSHIDGMYSFCKDTNENIVHLAAWTEVYDVTHLVKKTATGVTLDENYVEPPFTEIRKSIGRSGYGKDGKGEFRESALEHMSDEWVKASIGFVGEDHPHHGYYIQELHYRRENNIVIEDTEE